MDKVATEANSEARQLAAEVLAQDIDPDEWLGRNDSERTAYVDVSDGRRLKIAAITEKELGALMKAARKFDPLRKTEKTDNFMLRRLIICNSINKANGTHLTPDRLDHKLVGELTRIQKAIMDLSGMLEEAETPDPSTFFD